MNTLERINDHVTFMLLTGQQTGDCGGVAAWGDPRTSQFKQADMQRSLLPYFYLTQGEILGYIEILLLA